MPARFIYQFLDVFGLSLSLEDIQNLNDKCIGAKNQTILQALQKLHNDSQDIRSALLIFSLLHTSFDSSERLKSLDDELKIKILTYLMKTFNTREMLNRQKNGAIVMSKRDLCIWFLQYQALKEIDKEGLQTLGMNGLPKKKRKFEIFCLVF